MKVIKWLKKYFIPHEENDHRPHFLRWETAVIILGVVLFVEIIFMAATVVVLPKSRFFADILESVFIQQTNLNREASHLVLLEVDPLLTKAAQARAEDMALKGYFSHTSPEGYLPWRWMDMFGYKYQYAGENLAVNFTDSKDAIDAWMNSPTHRDNIMSANFNKIGIGIAKGAYKGKETFFVVQFFARPLESIKQIKKDMPLALVPNVKIATTSTSSVLGAETSIKESFIDTTNNEIKNDQISQTNQTSIKSNHGFIYSVKNYINNLVSSPNLFVRYLFLIISTIIIIALVLIIGTKKHIQFPKLLINGLMILVIIALALVLNNYLALFQSQVL